jgi:hypothetical protein
MGLTPNQLAPEGVQGDPKMGIGVTVYPKLWAYFHIGTQLFVYFSFQTAC